MSRYVCTFHIRIDPFGLASRYRLPKILPFCTVRRGTLGQFLVSDEPFSCIRRIAEEYRRLVFNTNDGFGTVNGRTGKTYF